MASIFDPRNYTYLISYFYKNNNHTLINNRFILIYYTKIYLHNK